jgi:hypothetical protein
MGWDWAERFVTIRSGGRANQAPAETIASPKALDCQPFNYRMAIGGLVRAQFPASEHNPAITATQIPRRN